MDQHRINLALQFLTSTCDLLRVAGSRPVIHPRRHHSLIARVICDLKFWRRFVLSRPKTSFDTLLARLPFNSIKLASDASALWGMAGVLFFGKRESNARGVEGLFWQLTWPDWYRLFPMVALTMGNIKINVAEFLALLITCETFTPFCTGKITDIETDNISAKS